MLLARLHELVPIKKGTLEHTSGFNDAAPHFRWNAQERCLGRCHVNLIRTQAESHYCTRTLAPAEFEIDAGPPHPASLLSQLRRDKPRPSPPMGEREQSKFKSPPDPRWGGNT